VSPSLESPSKILRRSIQLLAIRKGGIKLKLGGRKIRGVPVLVNVWGKFPNYIGASPVLTALEQRVKTYSIQRKYIVEKVSDFTVPSWGCQKLLDSDITAGDGKIANLFTVYYLCVQYMYNYPNSSRTGSFCGSDPLLRLTVSLRLVIQIFCAKLNLMVNLKRQ
jgi:hypothetical protein